MVAKQSLEEVSGHRELSGVLLREIDGLILMEVGDPLLSTKGGGTSSWGGDSWGREWGRTHCAGLLHITHIVC